MKYAIIENGKVVNTAIADAPIAANWIQSDTAGIGDAWDGSDFTAPVVPTPPVVPNQTEWLIDIGPFFDRFGVHKIPILANTDVVVQAIIKDTMSRKWIDLSLQSVSDAIDVLILKGHAVDKTAILTTPVTDYEHEALKKVYFK